MQSSRSSSPSWFSSFGLLRKAPWELIGSDFKGKVSVGIYAIALVSSPFVPTASLLLYVVVAGVRLIPDRRFELAILHDTHGD
jgi:hypothetical protein